MEFAVQQEAEEVPHLPAQEAGAVGRPRRVLEAGAGHLGAEAASLHRVEEVGLHQGLHRAEPVGPPVVEGVDPRPAHRAGVAVSPRAVRAAEAGLLPVKGAGQGLQ